MTLFFLDTEFNSPGRCVRYVASYERGSSEQHCHLQSVVEIETASAGEFTKEIKRVLGWDKPSAGRRQPGNTHLMSRELTGRHMHNFVPMVGYCMKDKGLPHFISRSKGIDEDVRYGSTFSMDCVLFLPCSWMKRDLTCIPVRRCFALGMRSTNVSALGLSRTRPTSTPATCSRRLRTSTSSRCVAIRVFRSTGRSCT